MREKYPTAADAGEFGLIARIARRLAAATAGPGVALGTGDDAALLTARDGLLASVDLLLEGPDFRRDWSGPFDIGAKAIAVGLADVAAMGAVPAAVLVGLALPPDTPVDWVDALTDGIADECRRAGAAVAGGDISGADRVVLSVTAMGDPAGLSPVRRSGAAPGQRVVLAGCTGRSAAGLAALQAGRDTDAALAAVIAAHRRPRVDYAAGRLLAEAGATSLIDVSDGLLADLGHIAEASGVRIDLDARAVPVADEVTAAAAALGADSREWVLTGGEDHAFAGTMPVDVAPPAGVVTIGEVGAGSGVHVDGLPVSGGGWRHF